MAHDIQFSLPHWRPHLAARQGLSEPSEGFRGHNQLFQQLHMYESIEMIGSLGLFPARRVAVFLPPGVPIERDA